MRDRASVLLVAVVVSAAAGVAASAAGPSAALRTGAERGGKAGPTTQPAAGKPTAPPGGAKPISNLDYWLGKAQDAKPVDKPAPGTEGANPFSGKDGFYRDDALPGVIEFSDGRQTPGWLYTTLEKPWEVYVAKEKRWRRIPFINVLSIAAVVKQERLEQTWRWKEMGAPERIYTGKQYPFRRFEWKLHLIDGSYVTGAIKGQPLWVELNKKKIGPFVFNERQKGQDGQKLKDLVYMKRVIISRKMMDKVVEARAKQADETPKRPPDKPAKTGKTGG